MQIYILSELIILLMLGQDNKENKTLGKNFSFSLAITIIIGTVNMAYPILIGLLYGPEIIGNFSVLFYWSTLLNIPISNGLAMSITRYVAANDQKESFSLENLGIKISFLYLLGVIIIYPIIGLLFFSLEILEVVIILFLLINLAFHYLFRKIMQGQEKFRFLFYLELFSFVIFIPIMILLCILPYFLNWFNTSNPLFFLFLPVIIYHLLFNILFIISFREKISINKLFKFPPETKRILLFALFIALGALFSIGMSQIQIVVSNEYLNTIELGVLSFWTAAIAIINIFTVAIGSLLLPRTTNLKMIDDTTSKKFINSMNWALTLIIAPLSSAIFVLFATYPIILDVITLYKFDMTKYWLIAILLCYKEVNLLIIEPTMALIFSSESKIRFYPIASFLSSISIVILWIFLTPLYGVFGFALGIAAGSAVLVLINLIYILIVTKKIVGTHIIIFLTNSLFSIGSLFIVYFWHNFILLIVWLIISIIAAGFGINLLLKILKDEKFTIIHNNKNKETFNQ